MTSHLKETLVFAVKEGGKFLLENFGRRSRIDYKGEINLVTTVDRESEKKIIKIIQKEFPDHQILTEESSPCPDLSGRARPYCWLIDPLDGTTNYAHGFLVFCVSIAVEYEREIILGAIYNPVLDELFFAEKGKGAFLNGKKIKVSSTKKLTKSLLATGFPYDIRESRINNLDHFANFALKAQAIRRAGSAALDLAYVACGRFDGFWELKLFPWDMAAGSLLVSESGGRVTNFRGEKFSVYVPECLATNGKIHQEMIKILKKGERK
ncbi:MAG: inositol monophosphatase family protein [Candidatus Edwardsbacteria bacterium]